ncbi:MAG: hypothetical protein M5U19_03550 [Microthrixaceae bacterium]|nr:hypothetical protein [Microthrixaceae bacterium]
MEAADPLALGWFLIVAAVKVAVDADWNIGLVLVVAAAGLLAGGCCCAWRSVRATTRDLELSGGDR